MKRVLRLTESDLVRLVKKVLNEQPIPVSLPILGNGPKPPECGKFMKSEGGDNPRPGDGSVLRGPFDMIKSNGSIGPEFQGYTVYKDGRPFCFISNR